MIFLWGAVIVMLWGFSTTSPVGVGISLAEILVVVVARTIEITSIRRIIPSVCVVITTRIFVITIIPVRVIVDYPCEGCHLVDDGHYRDASHSDVGCRRCDDCRCCVDRRIDVCYRR